MAAAAGGGKHTAAFGEGKTHKNDIGGKGESLAKMTKKGFPVPPGFTIYTDACVYYFKNNKSWPAGLEDEMKHEMKVLEKKLGKDFGGKKNPLLLSVRSGARVSMPGMMDTILNLGLNDESVEALATLTKNPRFAWDAYRRLIQMYGDVVMGVEMKHFATAFDAAKAKAGHTWDYELTAEELQAIVKQYKKIIVDHKKEFPQDVWTQLKGAVEAVFESWNNDRAKAYRKIYNMSDEWGTAVNVQSMVFGNTGDRSGSGVGFTRQPATGENPKDLYGEYLTNAQGEDVVSGVRTPFPLSHMKEHMPKVYDELAKIYKELEVMYNDMVDLEFTIEEDKLFMLQARVGKRTGAAAVKIAYDMVKEGKISEEEAVKRVTPDKIDEVLHKQIDPAAAKAATKLGTGLPASPGAAVGAIVFDPKTAEKAAADGKKVILVRAETVAEDVAGMKSAVGILTGRGGMTSHAAVVARGMGKCCVVGCKDVEIINNETALRMGKHEFKEYDVITLDGNTGQVYAGAVKTRDPAMGEEFHAVLGWCDKIRKLGVRANADTEEDANVSREFGAQGIGLCRTEHMFFGPDRIRAMREMIIADTLAGRQAGLAKILPFQRKDFEDLFTIMKGLPVTIRLLDPPLHEYLPPPDDAEHVNELADIMKMDRVALKNKIKGMQEFNPMIGFRGCRVGLVYPEIHEMQNTAIFEAACNCADKGIDVKPEVMIPLVGNENELKPLKEVAYATAEKVLKARGYFGKIQIKVGTMIELPRACVTADQIANTAEFFSFGTNDLTQTSLGFSRDDSGKFIRIYLEKGIFKEDPFVYLDQQGVGALMKIAIQKGRSVKPNLSIGVCGEVGGEPKSIQFIHNIGVDYVSCSPYRVPVARCAAAHAALAAKEAEKKAAEAKQ